eukprot:TRINITY_DN91279_c0_g1_i1.p2 TRINITY_DN91279_c0_g1~~TRINITY_DN91279_c0_g1_i1.p2  ORF type:complete len:131 (-),score=34.68 TRINITY_DN91279_c0_g1_i1:340-732(-)
MTKYVVCALFNPAKNYSTSQTVDFMSCWDESTEDAASKAQKCAEAAKLDWDEVSSCATGSQAGQLEATAAAKFVKRFPEHATGIFQVPHIFVDGKDQDSNTNYAQLLSAICAAGIKAAACKSSVPLEIMM